MDRPRRKVKRVRNATSEIPEVKRVKPSEEEVDWTVVCADFMLFLEGKERCEGGAEMWQVTENSKGEQIKLLLNVNKLN